MKKYEMLLASALLDLAHKEFINHTSGDLPPKIKSLLTKKQWIDLSREYHEFNGDLQDFSPKSPTAQLYDDAAMWVLSKKLQREAVETKELKAHVQKPAKKCLNEEKVKLEKIKHIVAETLEIEDLIISYDADLWDLRMDRDFPEFDDLDMLSIVEAVEGELNIEIFDDDIEKIHTIKDFLRYGVKEYGPIEKIEIINRKTSKPIVNLTPDKTISINSGITIRVVTIDDQGRRITFFMKKA